MLHYADLTIYQTKLITFHTLTRFVFSTVALAIEHKRVVTFDSMQACKLGVVARLIYASPAVAHGYGQMQAEFLKEN